MTRMVYAISQQSARHVGRLAYSPAGRSDLSDVQSQRQLQTFHIVKLTAAATAASTDQLTKTTAQIYSWNPSNTPGSLSSSRDVPPGADPANYSVLDVWNPHNVEIPSGALCFIAKGIAGWLIVSPINWCPE